MVCIQCYLPPILFMIYMKFINPILAPYIYPLYDRFVTYFWGPEAAQASSACPIRPKNTKPAVAADGDASTSKTKED